MILGFQNIHKCKVIRTDLETKRNWGWREKMLSYVETADESVESTCINEVTMKSVKTQSCRIIC